MPTRAQLARLFALAHNAGLDNDALHDIIEARFKLKSVKQLSPSQYESLTRSLSQNRVPERTVIPPSAPNVSAADIAPLTGPYMDHPSHGHTVAMAARLDGDLFLDATEQDVALAGKLLDCFRTYRKRKRITVDQARAILRGWLRYHPEVWRESARRYLLQSSTKDEKYFEGICRRVARDSAVDASSVAVALPL